MFGLSTVKLVVIGVVIALIVGYIGFLKLEVSHYRTKADDIQAQFSLVIHTQAAKLAASEAAVKTQDAARQEEVAKALAENAALKDANLKEIRNHAKELASCKLPDVTRKLFNDPNGTLGPDQKDSTGKTNAGNDEGTSDLEKHLTPSDSPTLEALLEANEENKRNFELMRSIILQFQKLAQQNEANLNGTP